jgi:phosphotransferase system  glucose/maltose/N-acetylglucosamine-specific IIC component
MWSLVLVLALFAALNPVRLGMNLLLISRPRPVQNLLVYWVGCIIVGVPYMLVPLMVLHHTPMLTSFVHDLATPATVAGSTFRRIQIGIGVLVLSIAALMAVRSPTRQRAQPPTAGGTTSSLVLDSNTPIAISRLLGRLQDAPTEGGSAFRRLLGRARNAWENGSLWVALVFGLGSGATADEVVFILAIIIASGAAIGTQVTAAIAFVVGMLAVVEIILVSYLATPAKTQAVLRLLHDWVRTHRRQVLVAMFALGGVLAVANGTGSI